MIASDKWIRKMALEQGMIEPFNEALVAAGRVSYGLSSYGYDVRVGDHFKIFHNLNSTLVDPKQFDERSFIDHYGDCLIPPNSFVLAETVETFRIPRNVLCVCLGKSTYARCGIIVNVTPLEPEWEGVITIEISNTTPLPAKIYAGEGIAQILFFLGNEVCETSYADRKGKYQHQSGLTLPKVLPTAPEELPTASEDLPTASEDLPTASEELPTAPEGRAVGARGRVAP